MKGGRFLIPVLAVAAIAGGLWFFQRGDHPQEAQSPPPRAPEARSAKPSAAAAPDPSRIAMRPASAEEIARVPPNPMAAAIGSPNLTPEKEITLLLELFQTYRREFGAMPAGENNTQLMNALRGGNPRRLPIFPLSHPRLDAAGNLLDPWQQPYLFHPVSRDRLEIRSKGPDRVPFTQDDLVVPAAPPEGNGQPAR